MNKPTVILLSAKSGHGKDFTANIFKEQLEAIGQRVLITHYADLLKYICTTFFEWDGKKDEKGRTLLQYVGTDIIRKQKPDYWVSFLNDILDMFTNSWDYILIPDTRFPNEVKFLKQNDKLNVISVRINRPCYETPLTEEQQNHISETALDNHKFDYYICNTTKEEVEKQVDYIINETINPKRKIFIDLDCTLYNTVKQIVTMYDEDYCYYSDYEKIPWTEVRTWDFTELKAAKPEHINHYFNQKRFFDNVEMFESAKETIDWLSNNYKIVFVSHGYSPNLRLKQEYIKKHFPYAEFIGVNLKEHSDKSCVDMSGEGNIFIDDKSENLETSNADIKICFGDSYEWNDDFESDGDKNFNAFDWDDVSYLIRNDLQY